MSHTITIHIQDNGEVHGNLDGSNIYPQCMSEGEATTLDGQSKSILDQALNAILTNDLMQMTDEKEINDQLER